MTVIMFFFFAFFSSGHVDALAIASARYCSGQRRQNRPKFSIESIDSINDVPGGAQPNRAGA
ncbi:MAG: hypothetical protein JJE37_13010 [Methyloceanibacter sp.]|nr:hypothetical protein [Methyloceanibacter sp.]